MKKVYVCGSLRFLREIKIIEADLKRNNIDYTISKKKDNRGIRGCLEKIDKADVVYVVNPEGYIGKSVAVDIGYAYAKNKLVYSMCPPDDPSLRELVGKVLSPEAFIDLFKKESGTKSLKARTTNPTEDSHDE